TRHGVWPTNPACARARTITAVERRRTGSGRELTHRVNWRLPLRTASTTSADCIDHQLRLLFVYFVAAIVLVVCFHRLVRQAAIFSTLCHRAVRAKHTGQVVSSLGVNTTAACRV